MKGSFFLRKSLLIVGWIFIAASTVASFSPVSANSFSGNDCNQYRCVDVLGNGVSVDTDAGDNDCPLGVKETPQGFVCVYTDGTEVRASLRPPEFRVLEFWFVRILYAAWALAGIFFTFVLIWIGFYYLTSFGNEIALGEVVKRFRNWMIGFALVFLSYPALNTFFNVLSINEDSSCYSELQLPGFQFFFPTACGTTEVATAEEILAECTTQCGSGNNLLSLLGLERADCISYCNTSFNSCMDENTDDISGTPILSDVRSCLIDRICRLSTNRPSCEAQF